MKRNFGRALAGAALTFCVGALLTVGTALGQNDATNQPNGAGSEPATSPTEDAPSDEQAPNDRNRRDAEESDDPSAAGRATDRDRRDASPDRPDARERPDARQDPTFRGRTQRGFPQDARGQERDERGQQESRRPRGLGFTIEEDGQEGLTVREVQPESAAAQAGLRAEDRIVSADGRRFDTARRLRAYLGGQFGRRVPIIIERNGREYTVQFSPGGGEDSAWLGVYMVEDEEQEGAQVSHVYPTSPAARAGFREGDVILSVNGEQVQSAPDVIALVEEAEPGSQAEFVVRRNDQEIELTAKLGRRDAYVFFQNDRSRSRSGGEFDRDDPYGNVPPYMMNLEHDRRMAEQHQRMEEAIHQLREEIRQLREEISRQR